MGPLTAAFSLLTRGIDVKAQRETAQEMDRELSEDERVLTRALLTELYKHNTMTLSQLEGSLGDGWVRTTLPHVLAVALLDGLIEFGGRDPANPELQLTDSGKKRAKAEPKPDAEMKPGSTAAAATP